MHPTDKHILIKNMTHVKLNGKKVNFFRIFPNTYFFMKLLRQTIAFKVEPHILKSHTNKSKPFWWIVIIFLTFLCLNGGQNLTIGHFGNDLFFSWRKQIKNNKKNPSFIKKKIFTGKLFVFRICKNWKKMNFYLTLTEVWHIYLNY